jgi:hypothetical protein
MTQAIQQDLDKIQEEILPSRRHRHYNRINTTLEDTDYIRGPRFLLRTKTPEEGKDSQVKNKGS